MLIGDLPSEYCEHEDAEQSPSDFCGSGATEHFEIEERAPEEVRDDLHDCGCYSKAERALERTLKYLVR